MREKDPVSRVSCFDGDQRTVGVNRFLGPLSMIESRIVKIVMLGSLALFAGS